MKKRSYNKKSDYWEKIKKSTEGTPSVKQEDVIFPRESQEPFFAFAEEKESKAACGGGNVNVNGYRDGFTGSIIQTNQFPNIRAGIIPVSEVEGGFYGVNEAISVTYQAYHNYALLKNAINMLVDFSVTDLHIKTTNKSVRKFFKAWFDAIKLNDFMSQFFLEYYRSGNVFIYKFDGKIDATNFNMLEETYSAKSPEIPIRYTILNPMQVYLQRGASYTYGYVRMLSTYEIERLKNPQTIEDKQMFESFPEDIQRQILQGGAWRWIYVPLDQKRLFYVFYRKQDYEPLAIPMAYPILNDIELMMDMKRIDYSLVANLEQIMLLVTTGQKADQYNLGTGPKHLQALQNIFANQAIGRVLVADFTTEAKWVVPDLKDLLGPEKYERVYQDIKEGLQYMFFGEEKFSNASIKINVFLQSLKEGRRAFLENFLIPEAKKICQAMNFKHLPIFEFEEVKLNDEALMNRLYVQMAQLGLLTADELNTALKTNILPDKGAALLDQEEYREAREKKYFQPLGTDQDPDADGEPPSGNLNGRPAGTTGIPAKKKVKTPIGQKKVTKAGFSAKRINENLIKFNEFKTQVEAKLKKKFKITELNDIQNGLVQTLSSNIIINEKQEDWVKSIKSYIETPKEVNAEINKKLIDLCAKYNVDSWTGLTLLKSEIEF